MMEKKKNISKFLYPMGLLILLLVVLAGCSPFEQITNHVSVTSETVSTSIRETSTPTVLTVTSTSTSTATVTPTSTPEIQILSLNSFQEIPIEYLASGEIILNEASYLENVEHMGDLLFSFSSEDLEIKPFLQNLQHEWTGYYYVASPDNQWLAILRHVTNGEVMFYDLVVTSSDMNDLIFLPWNEDMSGEWNKKTTRILSWTGDNQNLLLGRSGYEFEEVVLYNPFTNTKEVIFPNDDFPSDVYNPRVPQI